ncbi:MAG TPA: cytochrome c-type biogenesis protein CcmH [Gaiellaceae bacterium]|jgi:cytochrome c-type biogenesis protein CcmH|nr:cytochrome c-type biogenesis protein CcmH [Gaiellaceae bacterium]
MRSVALAAVALVLATGPALASERHPTLNELENEVMCPVCGTTLAQSDSPAAQQIERLIKASIADGKTKSEIKDQLVDNYGEAILASPPAHGFNLLAWVLPLAGLGLAAALLGAAAWQWSRGRLEEAPAPARSANGRGPLDPELEQRVDEELARFD